MIRITASVFNCILNPKFKNLLSMMCFHKIVVITQELVKKIGLMLEFFRTYAAWLKNFVLFCRLLRYSKICKYFGTLHGIRCILEVMVGFDSNRKVSLPRGSPVSNSLCYIHNFAHAALRGRSI